MSSYLVIARKWRPALFDEIVGQAHVTRTLRNAVSSGRIAHAYLFSGPRGVGKTTAARVLAKCLNCEKGPTAEPCNTCSSCRGVTAGTSVDVFEIDGASNTSVDNVRELRESVRYVPGESRYKIYIIDEVHMLSTSAFNALLKTLEEPPPHAVFIFATTEVHKIPLTILSRCQRFDFKRIPFKEIHAHLARILTEEGIEFQDEALYTIAREADGSLRDAQSLLDQVLAFSGGGVTEEDVAEGLGLMDRGVLMELLGAVLDHDGARCLNIVEKIYDFGYDLKRAAADLLEYIRDLTVIKVAGGHLLDLPDSELDRLSALGAKAGTERLQMLFSVVSRGYEQTSRSAFPRYSFEMAVLKAAHLEDVRPLGEILARVEDLGKRLGAASAASAHSGGHALPGPSRPAAKPAPARHAGPAGGNTATGAAPRGVKAPSGVKASSGESPDTEDPGPSAAGEDPARYCAQAPETEGGGAEQMPTDLAGYMRKKIPSLGARLQDVETSVGTDKVEFIGGAEEMKIFEIKLKQIEKVCSEYLKKSVRVVITASASAGGQDAKQGADALVKEAVRMFGGRVIDDRRRQHV